MQTRVAAGIGAVSLFLFLAGCETVRTGSGTSTYYRKGEQRTVDLSTRPAVVPAHEHRCPVDGLTWSHRKKSCAAPVGYACQDHKAARP